MIFQAPQDIPDGTYDAILLSAEPQVPMDPTESVSVRWLFRLLVNDETVQLSTSTSLNMGRKSNTRRVLESLLGEMIAPGEVIDIDDYREWMCQVVVKTDSESGYSRIIDVLREKILLQDEETSRNIINKLKLCS